jgi:hypothetical protein
MAARIYVGNLPMDIRERDLEEMFGKWRGGSRIHPACLPCILFPSSPFLSVMGTILARALGHTHPFVLHVHLHNTSLIKPTCPAPIILIPTGRYGRVTTVDLKTPAR